MALKAFNLFGNKNNPKAPPEIVRSLKDLLYKLREPAPSTKVEDDAAKYMSQMKLIVQGTPEHDTSPDQVHQLVTCIIQEDILYELARSIRLLPFEARKDAQIIFSHILRFKPANSQTGEPPPSTIL
ncbi:Conidiophore development protein hymA [Cyphellophora attinorum]|uniref:Conidiophore development protein hymA n=1 Tax=Cyphellophora attinorum TaxID=1664694 RepID=A0A0N0NR02_9EURO|nr:Conidiophore development protein hymA [Phialophora attinorum]KPI44518.1 Conidiophore development protein hymA [Phialophora attinorum]